MLKEADPSATDSFPVSDEEADDWGIDEIPTAEEVEDIVPLHWVVVVYSR